MEDNRMPDLFRLIEIKVESDLQFGQWVRRIFSSMFNNRLISFFILLQLVLVLLSIPAYYEVRIKTANMKCDDNCRKDVKENIKYGEMISLAYDMLQDNVKSINYQENILGCDDFSEQLIECLYPDYEYEDDLIAFPNSAISSEKIHEDGSFFGFVAANKEKRDIAIVIRGSFTKDDWGANSRFYGSIWDYNYNETVTEIVSWYDLKDWYASFKGWWLISCLYSAINFKDVVLSAGFYDLYRTNTAVSIPSLKKQIEKHVNHLTASGEFKTITVTGHSLGGAIATIAALEIAMQLRCIDVISKPQIRLVTYSSPVVGNGILWKKLKQLGVSDRHYFITGDSVPYMFMQYNWLTSYTHGRDTRRLRLAPANEVLKPEWKTTRQKYIPFLNPVLPHSVSHVLYSMHRILGNVNDFDVALINKKDDFVDTEGQSEFEAMPSNWYNLETRPIFRDENGLLYERDLKGENTCNDRNFNKWARKFVYSYGKLYGKHCENDVIRFLKGKDKYI